MIVHQGAGRMPRIRRRMGLVHDRTIVNGAGGFDVLGHHPVKVMHATCETDDFRMRFLRVAYASTPPYPQ